MGKLYQKQKYDREKICLKILTEKCLDVTYIGFGFNIVILI